MRVPEELRFALVAVGNGGLVWDGLHLGGGVGHGVHLLHLLRLRGVSLLGYSIISVSLVVDRHFNTVGGREREGGRDIREEGDGAYKWQDYSATQIQGKHLLIVQKTQNNTNDLCCLNITRITLTNTL